MKLIPRVDRVSSWILLFSVITYVITGFDIQGRFLDPQLSSLIHLKYLFLPAELAFAFHASYAMSKAFKRWKINPVLSIVLIAIFLLSNAAFTIYYFYIQFFMR